MLLLCASCTKGNGKDNGNGTTVQEPAIDIDTWYCVPLSSPDGQEKNQPCHETMEECVEIRYRALGHQGQAGECERHASAYCFQAVNPTSRVTRRHCHLTRSYCLASHERGLAKGLEVTDCRRIPPP